MSIAVTGIIGVSKGYGGFETLAENLIGGDSPIKTVYCSDKYFDDKPRTYKGVKLVYLPIDSKGVFKISHTVISLIHAALTGHKTLLLLGVSGGIVLPALRLLFPKIKIVTNIDGLEWQRGKWNYFVRKILKISEYLCCKFSHVVIVDNLVLVHYVGKTYGFVPEEIVYGGEHALAGNTQSGERAESFNAFGLCRIVPENNVHLILAAFARSGKKIIFVGNWDSSVYGRKLKKQYSALDNIDILNPIFDLKYLFDLRSHCHVYVHGHSVGGTNPSLVEMMHFGKPIMAYDCNYNRVTMEGNGEFFSDADDLVLLLNKFSNSDGSSGEAMKSIATRKYIWPVVRREYYRVLEAI
jgi:glycosyltransferase involved in cell wall biosynthesis